MDRFEASASLVAAMIRYAGLKFGNSGYVVEAQEFK
jgi:hypothetical protein